MSPIITSLKGLIAKAVQHMTAPATVTDIPMSKCRYLLTIFASMSSPHGGGIRQHRFRLGRCRASHAVFGLGLLDGIRGRAPY